MDKIFTKGQTFVDASNRERIFYGVNIVDKRKSCDDNKYEFNVDDALLTTMENHGLNILRLGTTWSMVEPEPNHYNDAYLDDMMRIFDLCEKHNIYVLFDMHQDLYSPKCYGDGAPDWATLTNGVEPKEPKFVWAAGYFWGKATQIAFDNFWNNAEVDGKGLLDYYAAMWQHIAKRFAKHPAFWGFDMLNEPFLGTDGMPLFRNIVKKGAKTVLFDKRVKFGKLVGAFINKEKRDRVEYLEQITGEVLQDITKAAGYKYVKKFDEGKYSNFLNKTSTAIREVSDDGILVMENCYWSNICIPCSTPEIQVNGKRDHDFCFTPHGYDFMVDTPQYKYASNDRGRAIFEEHTRTQARLKCPVMVGEWGGFGGGGSDWLPHIEFLTNFFEDQKWSFTYWHFDKDMFTNPMITVLSRPHPVAVAGNITSYRFDSKAKTFTLEYEGNEACEKPTVVYVHAEPKSIKGNEYEITKLGGDKGAANITFKTTNGTNKIKITF